MNDKKVIWIDEESFLKMIKIGWIDYNNARLDKNRLNGVELPEIKRFGYFSKPKMKMHEINQFIKDL
ncbi:MAG: hypothetical protein PV362_17165 [Providencia heimbachae]|nr:hypothetical protein [Providencia heimbachae]